MDIKYIEQILEILKTNDVTEFELEANDTHIRLTRGPKAVAVPMGVQSNQPPLGNSTSFAPNNPEVVAAISPVSPSGNTPPSGSAQAAAGSITSVNPAWVKVESPLVGTFYRKPSPDAEPFSREGDHVKKGSTLCIVEAMKLMNEIESPCDGKVEKVLLTDGEVVEFGEVLFLINPES